MGLICDGWDANGYVDDCGRSVAALGVGMVTPWLGSFVCLACLCKRGRVSAKIRIGREEYEALQHLANTSNC